MFHAALSPTVDLSFPFPLNILVFETYSLETDENCSNQTCSIRVVYMSVTIKALWNVESSIPALGPHRITAVPGLVHAVNGDHFVV